MLDDEYRDEHDDDDNGHLCRFEFVLFLTIGSSGDSDDGDSVRDEDRLLAALAMVATADDDDDDEAGRAARSQSLGWR